MVQNFNGGHHIQNYATQKELNLENKVTISFRGYSSLQEKIKDKAKSRGLSSSKYLEAIVSSHFDSEDEIKALSAALDKVMQKKIL